jgi:transcriptional regulator with XRE-family HTH domain
MRLSDQIRAAIRESGFPLSRLCEEIGIDQGTGSRFLAGESGLSIDTLDKLAAVLGLKLSPPNRKELRMLALKPGTTPRLRFVNNIFEAVVYPPLGEPFHEWEEKERATLREKMGMDATLSHYTCGILVERASDSKGLRTRRETVPPWVFDKFLRKEK